MGTRTTSATTKLRLLRVTCRCSDRSTGRRPNRCSPDPVGLLRHVAAGSVAATATAAAKAALADAVCAVVRAIARTLIHAASATVLVAESGVDALAAAADLGSAAGRADAVAADAVAIHTCLLRAARIVAEDLSEDLWRCTADRSVAEEMLDDTDLGAWFTSVEATDSDVFIASASELRRVDPSGSTTTHAANTIGAGLATDDSYAYIQTADGLAQLDGDALVVVGPITPRRLRRRRGLALRRRRRRTSGRVQSPRSVRSTVGRTLGWRPWSSPTTTSRSSPARVTASPAS